jgi:hypothetical protein
MDKQITQERLERVARMYKSNEDASQALGIKMRSFGRLCRNYGIETPYVRKCRLRREAARGGATGAVA